MPSIHFVTADGERHTVDTQGATGSLMELAVMNGVPGILGDCGGSASCGTCHLMIDEAHAAAMGPASALEDSLLEGRADRSDRSRLGCQIAARDAPDGLVVHLPASQY